MSDKERMQSYDLGASRRGNVGLSSREFSGLSGNYTSQESLGDALAVNEWHVAWQPEKKPSPSLEIAEGNKMNQAQGMLLDGLSRTKHVASAALFRIEDGKILASTPGFNVHSQAQFLIEAFYKNLYQVRRNGLYFKGQHYDCIRADDSAIYAKSKDNGVVAVKTKSLILVATYTQGMYPSVCVEAVEKLADYFREKGN